MNTNVVAISPDPQRTRLLDALLSDDSLYDAVVIETIARGYSRIKREKPGVVVVYLSIEDAATCQLLSMLALDPETSGIPVVTWAERYDDGRLECLIADGLKDSPARTTAVRVN